MPKKLKNFFINILRSDKMRVLGIVANENEMKGNYREKKTHNTLMGYFVLNTFEIEGDKYLNMILKDIKIGV